MNAVDVVLLLSLLYAAGRGYRQGALSQVAAFGGAAAGLVAGAATAPRLAGMLVAAPGPTLALLTLALLLAAIALGQAIGVGVGYRLREVVAGAGGAVVDRTAGVAVGMTALLLAVWLLGSVLAQGPSRAVAREVRQSRIVATVAGVMPPPPDLFGRVAGYLDQQGFPQVFTDLRNGRAAAPPVRPPGAGAVAAAQQAGQRSTVQVLGTGCGGLSSGSGFVTEPGFVVTNAHVVAGSDDLVVRSEGGERTAQPVLVDADVDLAVLAVPGLDAPAIGWAFETSRGTAGATLGFPHGRTRMVVKPAAVRSRVNAVGRDIYGRGLVTREVLTLSAAIERGDSGGPFVTAGGQVAGVVFAAAASEPGSGYALTVEQVRDDVAAAVRRNRPAATGACRY